MRVYKLIATFFGVGYVSKGGGTLAAFVVCVLLYLCHIYNLFSPAALGAFSVLVLLVGTPVASKLESSWGKDNKRIVIDEVLGMAVSLLFVPINLITLSAGFILFRFFDIAKPLGIRKMERLPGGWGVMADDLVAGIYANLLVQLLVYCMKY